MTEDDQRENGGLQANTTSLVSLISKANSYGDFWENLYSKSREISTWIHMALHGNMQNKRVVFI